MRNFGIIVLLGLALGGCASARSGVSQFQDEPLVSSVQTEAPAQLSPPADLSKYGPGTIIVNTPERKLYYIDADGRTQKYDVGVGREGFTFSGTGFVGAKQEWPAWHAPKEMIARDLRQGKRTPAHVEGGRPDNPLGARALYIHWMKNGKAVDSQYRIHGTNQPRSIGGAESSGCIRMMNYNIIRLYQRVPVGTKVVVLQ